MKIELGIRISLFSVLLVEEKVQKYKKLPWKLFVKVQRF